MQGDRAAADVDVQQRRQFVPAGDGRGHEGGPGRPAAGADPAAPSPHREAPYGSSEWGIFSVCRTSAGRFPRNSSAASHPLLPIHFFPQPEDFPEALPPAAAAQPASPEEMQLLPSPGEDLSVAALDHGAACGVCGDPLAGDLVRCDLCDTPHHRECWEYIGGCTTFACEGRPEDVPEG